MIDNIEDANHTRGPCSAETQRFFLCTSFLQTLSRNG